VIPAINRLPILAQREIGALLGERATRSSTWSPPRSSSWASCAGRSLRQIKRLDDVFGTAYGITWLVALIAATLLFLWGKTASNLAPVNPDGTATAELEAATDRVKLVVVPERVGFLVMFTCMILMRFGL